MTPFPVPRHLRLLRFRLRNQRQLCRSFPSIRLCRVRLCALTQFQFQSRSRFRLDYDDPMYSYTKNVWNGAAVYECF